MVDSKPFDRDLFYRLCEKYNVELSDKYDKPMLKEPNGTVRPLTDDDVNDLLKGEDMYKQIIIVRKDLAMTPGKMSAQVSHAAMAFLTSQMREHYELTDGGNVKCSVIVTRNVLMTGSMAFSLKSFLVQRIRTSC